MNTRSICFCGEIRKNQHILVKKMSLIWSYDFIDPGKLSIYIGLDKSWY